MRVILKHSSDGFGTLIFYTKSEAGVKLESVLLDTKRFCFICINKIVHEDGEGNLPPPSTSLEWVERHLGMNLKNCLMEHGNVPGMSAHPFLLNLEEKTDNFQATLCNDCAAITSILSRPCDQSGEIGKELDVKTALNSIQTKIEESDKSGRWDEFYKLLERPPKDIRMAALTSLGRILRRDIIEKCKSHGSKLIDGQRHRVTFDRPENYITTSESGSDGNIQPDQDNENGTTIAAPRDFPNHQILPTSSHSGIASDSPRMDQGTHDCTFRGKTIKSVANLEIHMRAHTNERPFVCTICNSSFKRNETYKYHIDTHRPNRNRPFQCALCPGKFFTRGALKRHQSFHIQTRIFKCKSCPLTFKSSWYLARHHKGAHTSAPIKCILCEKVFANQRKLNEHLRGHKYHCEICKKLYDSKQRLYHHARSHVVNQDRPFRCDYCGKGYFSKDELRKHIDHHPNKNMLRFQCEICEVRFVRKGDMKKHLQRHETGRKLIRLTEMKAKFRLE